MFYSLNDDVYIVDGASKSCIYDLNTLKLYHINKNLSVFINSILGKDDNIQLNNEEISMVNRLLDTGILKVSEEYQYNDIMQLAKKEHSINFVWLEICTYCNLKCRHCYNEADSYRCEIMSFEDFKRICNDLISIGIKKIQLIGGEPFCHKDLKSMLEYVSGKFEYIEVFTNGTLITNDWFDFLSQNNIRIALSIYSYISNNHDYVTQVKGSHEKTINTISKLKQYNIKYRIATTHMKNVEIGEKNTDLFNINPKKDVVRMAGRGNISLLDENLLKKKLITVDRFSAPLNKEQIINSLNGHNCFSKKLYISANLEVYPCVMERRISHGNLKNNFISDILDNNILSYNKSNVQECCNCEFRYTCYDCRPDTISNKFNSKPYICTYDVYNGKWQNVDKYIHDFFILNSNLDNV
ncbi:MAG: radical SAM/SPASM domain-containing protein [Oscillospiraceae bacterium]